MKIKYIDNWGENMKLQDQLSTVEVYLLITAEFNSGALTIIFWSKEDSFLFSMIDKTRPDYAEHTMHDIQSK